MGFGGNDPVVAKINGENISYSHYLSQYNDIVRLNGGEAMDQRQADMIYTSTWRPLITRYLMQPGFLDMGIGVSEAERMAVVRGCDPYTGDV